MFGAEQSIVPIILDFILFAFLVYTNLYFLIPRFLYKSEHGKYLFYLSILLIIGILLRAAWANFSYDVYLAPEMDVSFIKSLYTQLPMLLIVMLFSMAMQLGIDWFKQRKRTNELEVEKLNAEIQFLRSQVNPHFMFNTLNNLYALTLKKSNDAPRVVMKLSEMMRYIIYDCNEPTVPLEHEIEYLENYLTLEKLRLSKIVTIEFKKSGQLEDVKIPPLLLLPFVENAFKHGLRGKGDHFIRLDLDVNEDHIQFHCENSIGKIERKADRPGGIGIQNVRKRLDLLYSDTYKLRINKNENTFEVSLKLPRK